MLSCLLISHLLSPVTFNFSHRHQMRFHAVQNDLCRNKLTARQIESKSSLLQFCIEWAMLCQKVAIVPLSDKIVLKHQVDDSELSQQGLN